MSGIRVSWRVTKEVGGEEAILGRSSRVTSPSIAYHGRKVQGLTRARPTRKGGLGGLILEQKTLMVKGGSRDSRQGCIAGRSLVEKGEKGVRMDNWQRLALQNLVPALACVAR